MTSDSNIQRVAIITGASSGIGMEIALAYAAKGYAVVLAARRARRLETIAEACRAAHPHAQAMVAATDVADESQVRHLVTAAQQAFGRIDVMVNNAGYGHFGLVHEIDTRELREIFDVNFFGVFYGCKAVAPIMIAQGSGHIFNISSVLGKRGSPFYGAYSASKFAICGLTDSLRVELRPMGVRVTSVCPGLIETEFSEHVVNSPDRAKSEFFKKIRRMPAAVAARKIVALTGKNRPEIVLTAGGKFLTCIAALSPRLTDKMMAVYYRDQLKMAGMDQK
ncbi:MAG: SDR family oxidoreductase [Planctomycetaceae bacterium]|nr:SDR family oxidoreductase [Planctomycetaceae bacterium]